MDDITLTELIARLQDIAEQIDKDLDRSPDEVLVRVSTGHAWPLQHLLGEMALTVDGEPVLYLELGDHPDGNPYTPDLDDAERF